ncbi:MAG: DMT family transporter [Acetobacteraceae bacterium]
MTGDATILGIGLGVLAYGLFAVHDACIKSLVETIPVWQVLFARSATVLVACLLIGRGPLIRRAIDTPLKQALIFRACITMTAWLCYYTAARSMGLGQLLTLYFAAPIIVTLLAARVLQETVTPARWAAVGVGFVGVMFASDPFGVPASLATVLVLIAAGLWGYAIILMRQIARRETSLIQMLFNNAIFLVCTGIASAVTWHPPDLMETGLLLSVGIFGGCAQYLVFEMARRTPASVMATVEYSALIWAFALGYLIWGDVPSISVWAGAALIASAGGILVVAERMRSRSGAR